MDEQKKKYLQKLFVEALEEAKLEEADKPNKPLSELEQEKLVE